MTRPRDADVTNIEVTCETPPEDGGLDGAFGTDGRITSDLLGGATKIAVQSDGSFDMQFGSNGRATSPIDSSGALDTAFGTDGGMQIDFFGAADTANAVAIQPDGKILIGGTVTNGTITGLGLARVGP